MEKQILDASPNSVEMFQIVFISGSKLHISTMILSTLVVLELNPDAGVVKVLNFSGDPDNEIILSRRF
jgi:hypothetical protein